MKKQLLLLISLLILAGAQSHGQQPGRNCFNTQFHPNASELDKVNAYLLAYITTMSYADYLRLLMSPPPDREGQVVTNLRDNFGPFLDMYSEKLTYLFTPEARPLPKGGRLSPSVFTTGRGETLRPLNLEPNVTFSSFAACDPNGYDPEAILISTPNTVYVVFRGTDRVNCNRGHSFGYEWNEWLRTNFRFFKTRASVMHNSIRGEAHRGMVLSLMYENFAEKLATAISAVRLKRDGVPKKVWISGHSLGGAHAQLFAMYLNFNKNIKAQGIYLYESPHPGDEAFVHQLNEVIGKNNIQRFEFGDDPICTLPPQVFGFARAGERNFYEDYNRPALTTEQTLTDDAKIFCAFGNLGGEQIPDMATLEFPPYCPGSTCFHHPTFILQALRHDLNTTVQAQLPNTVPLPVAGDNCNQGDLAKAADYDVVNVTADVVEHEIVQVVWSATHLVENLLDLIPDPEGQYKLVCNAFKTSPNRYLHWDGTVGSQLTISTTGTVFNLTHKGTGGYQLWKQSGNMAADVHFPNFGGQDAENSNNILMTTKDGTIGDEETWFFLRIPNTTHTYALYNVNTHALLDAPDQCLTDAGNCRINEFAAASNDPTQVWILERQ
jgi:hypothetical protein